MLTTQQATSDGLKLEKSDTASGYKGVKVAESRAAGQDEPDVAFSAIITNLGAPKKGQQLYHSAI